MNRLERFRGHFYNWYDTRDLRPLEPKYVSSVDSGNLAGHLIALGNACREMANRPVIGAHWLPGSADTLELLRESLHGASNDASDDTATGTREALDEALDDLRGFAASLRQIRRLLPDGYRSLLLHATKVTGLAQTLTEERRESSDAGAEVPNWAEAAGACVLSHQRDLET